MHFAQINEYFHAPELIVSVTWIITVERVIYFVVKQIAKKMIGMFKKQTKSFDRSIVPNNRRSPIHPITSILPVLVQIIVVWSSLIRCTIGVINRRPVLWIVLLRVIV